MQLRYGCQDEFCTVSTCFSCRKRLSGGAPVRRYNATSARTLAVYLSSQDNPEQGLCYNTSAPIAKKTRPIIPREKKSTVANGIDEQDHLPESRAESVEGNAAESATLSAGTGTILVPKEEAQSRTEGDLEMKAQQRPGVDVIDERTTIDHKSFVQNVFSTVAFKMLEWLTPRNLEVMAAEGEIRGEPTEDNPSLSPKDFTSLSSPVSDKSDAVEAFGRAKPADPISENTKSGDAGKTAPKYVSPNSQKTSNGDALGNASVISNPHTNTAANHPSSPNLRRKTDNVEPQRQKGILSIPTPPDTTDMTSGFKYSSRELTNTVPQRRESLQNLTGSEAHGVRLDDNHNGLGPDRLGGKSSEIETLKASETHEDENNDHEVIVEASSQSTKIAKIEVDYRMEAAPGQTYLPQSLSHLSIEIIDLVCDIMQTSKKREKHNLQPKNIDSILRHDQWKKMIKLREFLDNYRSSKSSEEEWLVFIEQSLFDVLSRPESLLRSFTDNHQQRLFDTQTIWYCMLRMTRVAPSLVFDSLWIAAGSLFHPPEKIDNIYESPKESPVPTTMANKSLSNTDAIRVMNLCLHALVAAAPLATDARQLANMSRIRSYGLTMLGKNMASLEAVALCLQYDDAFTNELALRLARRMFAAIPTRRRFTELLELQQEVRSEEMREQDILEAFLSTIKFIDSTSMLYFPAEQRMLHETRVPTLILDWARTVMLQDWKGAAEVPGDGSFGGALAMMAAICEPVQSPSLED